MGQGGCTSWDSSRWGPSTLCTLCHTDKATLLCPPLSVTLSLPAPCQRLCLCDLLATWIIGFVINYFGIKAGPAQHLPEIQFLGPLNAILG